MFRGADMKLVYAKGKPISPDKSFAESFIHLMGCSDYLQIATGYVSEDSLLFLIDNLENDKNLKCDLLIGMHVYDGFTVSQYNISKELGKMLSENKRGSVLVCCAFPYHGKFYNFFKDNNHLASLTGSANITQILPTRQRNLTIQISDKNALSELNSYFDQLTNFCQSILDYKPREFIESGNLIKDCIGVTKLRPDEVVSVLKTRKKLSFNLPLKPEKRSNLNICYGKGRENYKNGIMKPRSWFEYECIVDKPIRNQKGYPRYKRFHVLTDDGWMFECSTHGDDSKNFRSTGGLAILGMWVKGRMLDAGVVKAGEFITNDMLEKFGKDHLVLSGTDDPDIWLLDFG